MRARDGVLHLGEAHQPRAGEDRRGAVDPLRAAGKTCDEAVEARDLARETPPSAAEELKRVIGQQHVIDVRRQAPARPRRLGHAVVRARERRARVREGEELEMVVAQRKLLEALEHVPQRRGRVDPMQREGGHAAQRHLRDHAQRAQPDACGAPQLLVALARALEHRPIGEHQRQLVDLRGEVAQPRAGAMRGRRDRTGDALDVDVADVLERQPVLVEVAAELADGDPGLHAHQP